MSLDLLSWVWVWVYCGSGSGFAVAGYGDCGLLFFFFFFGGCCGLCLGLWRLVWRGCFFVVVVARV